VNYDPASEIRQIAIILGLSLIVGLAIGYLSWTLVFSLSGYIIWNLRQLFRLYYWLKKDELTDPPASHGLWGSTFDHIYQLQKGQLKYRARLKKVIKRFRDSTYALKDGFVMLDSNGHIDWWNPAAKNILGLRAPFDSNQLITNLIRHPKFISYFESENHDHALEIPSPLNTDITLEFQITRFGKQDHLIVVRDVTELKQLDNMRTDFVANVSHELRTPLTVIDGYLEAMSDNIETLSPPWHKPVNQMSEQTRRMSTLINDLLLLSRIESRDSSIRHTPVDVGSIITSIRSDLSTLLAEKQQSISIELPSNKQLLGPKEQTYSLIGNLITNASKYSGEGASIKVVWQDSGEGAQLSVEDNGIGIAPMDIPRLTERFYRVDRGRAQAIKGTGLGLAIVKHALINLDGTLDIQSKVGVGSTFSCHFPEHRLQELKQQAS
jgi:two-component system, OmpR family, phosphate regulon sensor histidine kinase PhoR